MLPLTETQRASGAYLKCLKLCRDLLKEGVYPGPTVINRHMGRHPIGTVNGIEAQARIQALLEAGYALDPATGRYKRPDPLEGLRRKNWKNLERAEECLR